MKKRRYITIFALFTLMFISLFNIRVNAKEVLKSEEAVHLNGDVVGSIYLYDDYTMVFNYMYRLSNVEITICKENLCDEVEPQIKPNQNYIDKLPVEFSLAQYLVQEDVDVKYVIKAKGDFKPTQNATFSIETLLNETVTIKKEYISGDDVGKDEFDKSVNKVQEVFNKWVIPCIYMLLAVVLVVKAILLCIDLVKYSDNPSVRKEKLMAFIYLFVGLLVVAIINSTIGFITGLFKFD